MIENLSVLIVGLGSIGRRHLRNLRRIGIKNISAYRTKRGTLELGPELNDVVLFDSLSGALAQKPNVVFVTNPSSLHLEVCRNAIEAGSHVFVEKPISHRLDGVEEFLSAAKQKRLLVGVGYDLRFNTALRAIKACINDGSCGRVLSVDVQVGSFLPNWHPWEDYRTSYSARAELGGGVLLTLSHEIDLARWLAGEIVTVSAEVDHLSCLELDCEDVASLVVRFQNRAIGTIHLDYVQDPSYRQCRVVTEKGNLEWTSRDGTSRWFQGQAVRTLAVEDADDNLPFVEEIREFLEAVVRGSAPRNLANGHDGARAVQIVMAALDSSREGRRIVIEGNPA